jgi:hypothetical protein
MGTIIVFKAFYGIILCRSIWTSGVAEISSCKILFLDLILEILALENIAGSQFSFYNAPNILQPHDTWLCVCVFP